MSAPLDLTKPLRNGYGDAAVLLGTNFSAEGARGLIAGFNGRSGRRDAGQTLACLVNNSIDWFYPDGRFIDNGTGRRNLENVPPPPVVVKTRRGVITDGNNVLRTTGFLNEFDVSAIVEFTVTDGKLTAVEIVS